MMEMKIFALLVLGLTASAFTFDSAEVGSYETLINHDPSWNSWNFDSGGGGGGGGDMEESFQYFYPFFSSNDKSGSFNWNIPPIKIQPPKPPVAPSRPTPPDMANREWPSWLPPIHLVKLPLDTPPDPLNN